jgi:nucleoside-diphosphate-sugar epimerase
MKTLVTGGTGFVGSHIAATLMAQGHDVRLLVRRPEQVPVTFAPHGVTPTDTVVGDVRDRSVVAQALEGCDAVVHAAAVFSFDTRRAALMASTNAAATEAVLGAAVERRCDPVVHVSSTVILARRGGSGPDLPLGDVDLPYTRSKLDSERLARLYQEAGAPVVTVYPGAVYGPHDPYTGEQSRRLAWVARGLFPIWFRGGLHSVDVREVAALVAAALVPGQGPRRYVVPGHHATADDVFGAVSRAIGHARPHVALPGAVAAPVTRGIDILQARLPERWRYPADHEGTVVGLRDTRMDDERARRELGITPRPFEETVRDTIEWMVAAGRLPERYRPRS